MSNNDLQDRDYTRLVRIGEKCNPMSLLDLAIAFNNDPYFEPTKLHVDRLTVTKIGTYFIYVTTSDEEGGDNKNILWTFSSCEEEAQLKQQALTLKSNINAIVPPGQRQLSLWSYERQYKYDSCDAFKLGQMIITNIRRDRDEYQIKSHCEDPLLACQFILNKMFDVFLPDMFECTIHNDASDMTNAFPNRVLHKIPHIELNAPKLNKNEFDFVMTNFRPKKTLYLNFKSLNPNLIANFDLTLDELELEQASYFTEANLYQLKSKNISLRDTTFKEDVINRFIKHWLDGNNSQLEQFTVDGLFSLRPILQNVDSLSLRQILEKTNLTSIRFDFDETLHERARYLVRDDGKIAIVTFRKHFDSFLFQVWNETQPTRTV